MLMNYRILIVDDQKGVRRLLEELFKKEGFIIDCATDGQEAIQKTGSFNPHIILMDMKMPKMNGLEAAQEILNKYPDSAIIMMTAYGEIQVVKEAIEAGVKKCLTKPFDILLLRKMVLELLDELYG